MIFRKAVFQSFSSTWPFSMHRSMWCCMHGRLCAGAATPTGNLQVGMYGSRHAMYPLGYEQLLIYTLLGADVHACCHSGAVYVTVEPASTSPWSKSTLQHDQAAVQCIDVYY